MRTFRFLTFVILFFVGIASFVQAVGNNDMEYAKNYLIILVHGIGDDHTCLADEKWNEKGLMTTAKKYLEDMGLTGYVYAYEFSDKFLNIEKEGWEFGNRAYDNPEAVNKKSDEINDNSSDQTKRKSWEITKKQDNGRAGTGKCWLEQAKEDFRIWFQKYGPGKTEDRWPLASEIPQKFIVIAHSMGGLAVRHYIYGKDSQGRRYYQGDIEKVVYIDVPHLGSTAGKAAIWAEENATARYGIPAIVFLATFNPAYKDNPPVKNLLACNAGFALAGSALFDKVKAEADRHKTPALTDMLPNSSFLNNVNSAGLGDFSIIRQQIIVGKGAPTASDMSSAGAYVMNFLVYERIMASLVEVLASDELSTFEQKMMSMNLTIMSGYPFFEDGDLVVTTSSQKGEGISNLSGANVQEYQFRSSSIAAGEAVTNAIFLIGVFIPYPLDVLAAVSAATGTYIFSMDSDDGKEFSMAHVEMKNKRIFTEGLLEKALFEGIQPAGASSTSSVMQVPFTLTSNLTIEAGSVKVLESYHEVSVEAMTEARAGNVLATPIIVDGKEKRMEIFTVKEPPTKITGVLRDFMPKKMQYFQYSENFAAWMDVSVKDEWGNFEIDGLKLAEGQNMIAFRAKNKVGYTSNQHLKIILNTIPMVPSELLPLSGTYTGDNKLSFSGKFAKASYSEDKLENTELTSAKLIYKDGKEVDVTDKV